MGRDLSAPEAQAHRVLNNNPLRREFSCTSPCECWSRGPERLRGHSASGPWSPVQVRVYLTAERHVTTALLRLIQSLLFVEGMSGNRQGAVAQEG